MQQSDLLKRRSGPALTSTILHREALVRKLNEVLEGPTQPAEVGIPRYKLVMLCSPAGYGKTTLLADFAQKTSFPCCWYFLDSTDVDEIVFLNAFIQTIRYRFPDFGRMLDPLLASVTEADVDPLSPTHHAEGMIDAISTALASEISERTVIFLCNYHEVNNSRGVNNLVNRLLQNLPPQCALVVESRAVPDLDLALLAAQNEVIGFDETFLRFTTQEIHDLAYVQGVTPLKQREAEQLTTLFDGWIAGILLGTHLGDRRILHSRRDVYISSSVPGVQIDRQNLFAYLVNVVFSRDHEVYSFLKYTAILPQMTPDLCNALLGITNASERLQYLEQQGLFVTRSGDGMQITYTCHPVLRELLCDELRRESFDRFVLLHQRATEFWLELHNFGEAIPHSLEAGLIEKSASLINKAHESILSQGRMEMLSRWIDALPLDVITRYPSLLLARANIYLLQGEYTHALPLLSVASDTLLQQPELIEADERPLLQAAIAISRSEALFQIGEYAETERLCHDVIEQVPADEIASHAEAYTLLGACANIQGDYPLGISYLQKALRLWGRDSEKRQTAKLHNTLARVYGMTGNFALAEHHLTCAARCWDRLHDEWGKVNNLLNMGMIKQRQGEYTSAKECFDEALTVSRGPIHFQNGEAYALVNLGDLYQGLGLYEQSLAVTEDGLALARQLENRYLTSFTLCILSMTYLLMGDAETAMLLISEVAQEMASNKSGGFERANCELTRGTILLFQGQYSEAFSCLSELENHLQSIGLQWELIYTKLRLVECLLRQGHKAEIRHRIEEVATLLQNKDCLQVVLRELRHLPYLERASKTMPELAPLRALVQPEIESKEAQDDMPLEPNIPLLNRSGKGQQLKIIALGEPAIMIDEKPITRWRRPRAMELFFLLLDSGRPLRKEQIITALWPEFDEHIAQHMHSTVHYLRKSLGETCIASRGGTYWLDMASQYKDDVWYDVAAFQHYEAEAKHALAADDDVTAKAKFLAMVELYNGDYLQSFYSDWCLFKRDKLRIAYLDARQQLALIAWRLEQYDESAAHWQHILAVDSCFEDAHYGLMRYYMRRGKRGLALRQYQRCAEALQRELAVEPGSAIQNLLQHLIKAPGSR